MLSSMSEIVARHRRVRAIFESVHELPPPTRAAAVATACGDDSALRREVLELLEAAEGMGSFLQHGVARAVAPDARCGDRIGPYEITDMLASGGMGDVYRARDTRLGRDVALKLLPDVFLADPSRVARVRREAQILASLNHPHIATIHGLEEMEGVGALVLELITGPTLADRIAAGPLPLDQSLHIARQIVDALDAAHQSGVVHRDLKPANIKVRDDGIVKVLDFGLAKVIEPPRAPSDEVRPRPHDATQGGVVLGTAAYMSPEQANGGEVDKRTDIWAFGCVLFEMLTNRRPFATATGIDALVDSRDAPDLDDLPPALRRLLRRCLEPDRTRRLADIADARFDLAEAATAGGRVAETPRATGRGHAAAWLAAASLVAALWFAVAPPFHRPQRDTRLVRSSILLPGSISLAGALAVSPDGRSLAFTAEGADGRTQLWVRPLDSSLARPVAGTVNAVTPFWSPDGTWIAFVQDQKLRKVAAGGGEPVTLCDRAFAGGAWNQHDMIVFTTAAFNLAAVSASGGTPSALTRIDPQGEETLPVWPAFLPGGRHFLYVRRSFRYEPQVFLHALDGGADTPLPINATMVQVAGGFVWFVRDRTLMAQALDAERSVLTGSPIAVAEDIRAADRGPTGPETPLFSVSPAGIVAFQTDASPGFELVWYDRHGKRVGTLGAPADYADTVVSPDGTRVLVSMRRGSTTARDLWVYEVDRGVGSRITFDDVRVLHGGVWARDGVHVIYTGERGGRLQILQRRADGAGSDTVLLEDEFDKELASVTPDGRHLLYNVRHADASRTAWVLPLEERDGKPFPFSSPRAFFPQISPDGHWVAYMSRESGRQEIYVAPFPGPGRQTRVSPAGGLDPAWRADGREIVYLAAGNAVSAEVTLEGDTVRVAAITPLFPHVKAGPRKQHDVSPDGRILAVTRNPAAGAAPLTLLVNWPALVTR
jgi:Tol biopolymer transport system component